MFNFVIKNNCHRHSHCHSHNHGHCDREVGFTLIEFLLYSVIVAFVVGSLVLSGINILQGRAQVGALEEVNHNGKLAMEKITASIREAESINHPSLGSGAEYLSLKMPIEIDNPTIFEVDVNKALTIKRGVEVPVPITSERVNVSSLTFTNVSYSATGGAVRIRMEIKYSNPTGRDVYEIERTFYTTENIRR